MSPSSHFRLALRVRLPRWARALLWAGPVLGRVLPARATDALARLAGRHVRVGFEPRDPKAKSFGTLRAVEGGE